MLLQLSIFEDKKDITRNICLKKADRTKFSSRLTIKQLIYVYLQAYCKLVKNIMSRHVVEVLTIFI